MNNHSQIETSIGLFLLLAFAGLLFITIQTTSLRVEIKRNSYPLHANFENINGLKPGAPLRIGGVKIGEIRHIKLNPDTFLAETAMIIYNEKIRIPDDSSISILTDGLLGSKYAEIIPGIATNFIPHNGTIHKTYPPMIFEQIISQAAAYLSSKE